jgi:hypothetical protein
VRQRSAGYIHALNHPFLLSAVFCHAPSAAAPGRAASCKGDDGAGRKRAGRAGRAQQPVVNVRLHAKPRGHAALARWLRTASSPFEATGASPVSVRRATSTTTGC